MKVDFYLPKYRIAVEIDGPSHFVNTSDGLTPSMTTLAKHRFLRKCGEFDHVFQITALPTDSDANSFDHVMEQVEFIYNGSPELI